MGLITKNTHALINYAIGLLLTFSPWLFDFDAGGIATCLPWLSGLIIIFYTLIGDHKFGTVGGLSFKLTIIIDAVIGLVIAVSPWLFGFADYASASHLFSGLSLSINAFIAAPLGIPQLIFRAKNIHEAVVEKNKQVIINAANIVMNGKQHNTI